MKKSITAKAYAKINLSLDVLERMDNGYHRIKTVMQQISLSDDIVIESKGLAGLYTQYKINLETDSQELTENEDNIVYKAAKFMAETFCPLKDNKIEIKLNKRIPIAAGLAGGSSDAAATILALCKLWNIEIPLKDLCIMSAKLGADIPFCILGNAVNNPQLGFADDPMATSAAIAEGIGEILTPVPSLEGWVILVKPDISVSTGYIYEMLEKHKVLSELKKDIDNRETEELISGLKNRNKDQVIKNMHNTLETASLKEYPIIVYTKNKMGESGSPAKVLMSGSGPTVFGFFEKENEALAVYEKYINTFLAEAGKNYSIHLSQLL